MPVSARGPLCRRRSRRFEAILAVASVLALAGCGFHPVGSARALPKAMGTIYVASGQPYGYLENRLRRAIVAHGAQIAASRVQADAVLSIIRADFERRVLAVNTHGQPVEYQIVYRVRFGLTGAKGAELLAPQSLDLSRYLAYNTNIELASGRRQAQLQVDMQNEAVQLIMLRLDAVAQQENTGTPAR